MSNNTVEVVNDHREALALAVHEEQIKQYGVVACAANNDTLESARLLCNSIRFRCDVLGRPAIMQRYIANRGFDPRDVQSAPKCRWL